MNKKIIVVSFLIVIILVSVAAATIFYYDGRSQTTNLSSANLVTRLNEQEYPWYQVGMVFTPSTSYCYLQINGSVTNTGLGTAYNVGLHVVAYNATGTSEINMTIPLHGGIFGTDNATNTFVLDYGEALGILIVSNQTLGVLEGKETVNLSNISIFHEGTVTNWTVTPVWTITP
jgi:hypothetical protein